MTEQLLMQSPDGEPMNVPHGKVQKYLDAGWKLVPLADGKLPAVPPAAVAVETESAAAKKAAAEAKAAAKKAAAEAKAAAKKAAAEAEDAAKN